LPAPVSAPGASLQYAGTIDEDRWTHSRSLHPPRGGPPPRLQADSGWTNIFIKPGYEWKVVDAFSTNFHLPKSTLVMLVSAFAGRELVLDAYHHAIQEHYRFFSFGDAMFIY